MDCLKLSNISIIYYTNIIKYLVNVHTIFISYEHSLSQIKPLSVK